MDFNFCYIFIKFVFLGLKYYLFVREIYRNKNTDENPKWHLKRMRNNSCHSSSISTCLRHHYCHILMTTTKAEIVSDQSAGNLSYLKIQPHKFPLAASTLSFGESSFSHTWIIIYLKNNEKECQEMKMKTPLYWHQYDYCYLLLRFSIRNVPPMISTSLRYLCSNIKITSKGVSHS